MQRKVAPKRRIRRRRVCYFKSNKFEILDYKDLNVLSRFVTDRGKIKPKRNTGVSAKWQRRLAQAIKRARFIGLLPYCVD